MTATHPSTVADRLDRLYAIGGQEGANRPGMSPQEDEAHELAKDWITELGLAVTVDAACNLYGRLPGTEPELGEIWVGSHLDSVPHGGKYDGALGVVAAIEAVGRLDPMRRAMTIVVLRDEEGWRFGGGCFGSRAVTGKLDAGALHWRDAQGVALHDALRACGGRPERLGGWLTHRPTAFVELHVEQGPRLAAAGSPLGVVESFAGHIDASVRFDGEEGHAGTVPMSDRRDAGLCAAQFQVEVAAAAKKIEGAVATIGTVELEPGAANVIPRTARLTVDVRAGGAASLQQLLDAVRAAAEVCAQRHGCECSVRASAQTPPVVADPSITGVLKALAPKAPRLASGAGHDAQVFGMAGIPIGVLFVRSLARGISHSPREQSASADIDASIDVLTLALLRLGDGAKGGSGSAFAG